MQSTLRNCLLWLLLASLLACTNRGHTTQSTLPTNKADFHLYLLIGQSNMAGRGVIEPQDTLTHPRVWMLNKHNQWVPAKAPLHFDKPAIVGVGPGLEFGKRMAEANPKAAIGLIPCAVGGSPIAAWQQGAYYEQTKTHPYDDVIRRTRQALKEGTLKGILWHQGESDSQPPTVGLYLSNLKALIESLRGDLNLPGVPFVAGELGYFGMLNNPLVKQLNEQLKELPNQVSNSALVTAQGLTHKGDTIHFDSASARELGRRYAAQMSTLQSKPK
jgi:hypothetical protein